MSDIRPTRRAALFGLAALAASAAFPQAEAKADNISAFKTSMGFGKATDDAQWDNQNVLVRTIKFNSGDAQKNPALKELEAKLHKTLFDSKSGNRDNWPVDYEISNIIERSRFGFSPEGKPLKDPYAPLERTAQVKRLPCLPTARRGMFMSILPITEATST